MDGVNLGITEKVYRKSPQRNNRALPIGRLFSLKSLRVQSRASKDFLCAIVHSFHTIGELIFNMAAVLKFLPILHVGILIWLTFNGSLRVECTIDPLSNNIDVIPDDNTANAVLIFDRISMSIKLSKNVYPVLKGASKKIIPSLSFATCCITLSKTLF